MAKDMDAAVRRLTELKEEVAEADERRARAQGQLDAAIEQLKALGAKSVKDAVQKKEKLEAEVAKLESNFVDTVNKLDKWKEAFGV